MVMYIFLNILVLDHKIIPKMQKERIGWLISKINLKKCSPSKSLSKNPYYKTFIINSRLNFEHVFFFTPFMSLDLRFHCVFLSQAATCCKALRSSRQLPDLSKNINETHQIFQGPGGYGLGLQSRQYKLRFVCSVVGNKYSPNGGEKWWWIQW